MPTAGTPAARPPGRCPLMAPDPQAAPVTYVTEIWAPAPSWSYSDFTRL